MSVLTAEAALVLVANSRGVRDVYGHDLPLLPRHVPQ